MVESEWSGVGGVGVLSEIDGISSLRGETKCEAVGPRAIVAE